MRVRWHDAAEDGTVRPGGEAATVDDSAVDDEDALLRSVHDDGGLGETVTALDGGGLAVAVVLAGGGKAGGADDGAEGEGRDDRELLGQLGSFLNSRLRTLTKRKPVYACISHGGNNQTRPDSFGWRNV